MARDDLPEYEHEQDRETNWKSAIIANNTPLLHNPQQKFLEVTLDRLLTFGLHIQNISTKAAA